MRLSERQIDDYRSDGYCFPVRALSPDVAEAYRARFVGFDQSDQAASAADLHNDIYLFKPHLVLKWVDELVHEPSLLDVAASLLGPDLLCWSAGIFQKAPHSANYVSWHQDAVYYGLSPVDHVVRVWVALSPTSLSNGTMVFARRAHRLGLLPHDPSDSDDNLLTNNETVRFDAERFEHVTVDLQPGEISLHHLHMPHASGPNTSDDRRINVVITYISPDVAQAHGTDSALLVRGADQHGNFEPETRLAENFDVVAKRRHARAMALRHGIFKAAAAQYDAAKRSS